MFAYSLWRRNVKENSRWFERFENGQESLDDEKADRQLQKTMKRSKNFGIWSDRIAVHAFEIRRIYAFAFLQQFFRV